MKKVFSISCCLLFIILAFADTKGFVTNAQHGLLLFGNSVLPILFPFFFITSMLIELNFFSVFKKFGVSAPIFAVSTLSGYPTGARMLSELYLRGEISRNQAIQISTFTSTCSPIFVIATVGTCFYKSTSIGVIIFVCHITAAILNGFLYRKINFKNYNANFVPLLTKKHQDISDAVSNSLYSSVHNILAVGGLIIVFFIAVNQIQVFIPLPAIISGIIELTNGVFLYSSSTPESILVPCAIISFGGLAVAMQGFLFLKSLKLPFWFYMLYKTTHAIIAIIICLLFAMI